MNEVNNEIYGIDCVSKDRGMFYYCYSNKIKNYLLENGHEYVNIALNPKNMHKYWLFIRTDKLSKSLDEYDKNK